MNCPSCDFEFIWYKYKSSKVWYAINTLGQQPKAQVWLGASDLRKAVRNQDVRLGREISRLFHFMLFFSSLPLLQYGGGWTWHERWLNFHSPGGSDSHCSGTWGGSALTSNKNYSRSKPKVKSKSRTWRIRWPIEISRYSMQLLIIHHPTAGSSLTNKRRESVWTSKDKRCRKSTHLV